MGRATVLFMTNSQEFDTWDDDVLAALTERHHVRQFDASKPAAPQFEGVDAVVDVGGQCATRDLMDLATHVKLWQITSSGHEHVDCAYAREKGIPVANTPGPCSGPALADTAMMFILMLARRYRYSSGRWAEGKLYEPMSHELGGRILGIVGFGASGRDLARRAKAFGMRLHVIDVQAPPQEVLQELQPEFVGTSADLDEVVKASDFLSLHLHVKPDTEKIVDERRIRMMKPTACLINVARGALVDQPALFQALLEGRLGGAGLDVVTDEPPSRDEPALNLPNVIYTPHIAGVTYETSQRRAQCAVDNVDRIASGLEPLYCVNA